MLGKVGTLQNSAHSGTVERTHRGTHLAARFAPNAASDNILCGCQPHRNLWIACGTSTELWPQPQDVEGLPSGCTRSGHSRPAMGILCARWRSVTSPLEST